MLMDAMGWRVREKIKKSWITSRYWSLHNWVLGGTTYWDGEDCLKNKWGVGKKKQKFWFVKFKLKMPTRHSTGQLQ